MIRFASLALVLCAIPSFAQAQTFRIVFPAPRPVVVTPAPVVATPAPVIVQKTVIVNQAPAPVVTPTPVLSTWGSQGVVPVVAQHPLQPVAFEVFVRNGPFGFWESAGVFATPTQADAFASRMELRGYQVQVRPR
ncbi:MAG: hypothetical protein N2112_10755 [Gemmataceae bacterium]|jgi:hypothetical protein|nr:hypothetical protein [Gemmataceae bacterium]